MLQVVDGRPALLGIYPTVIGGTELHYARADDENGSSWPEPVEFSFNFVGDKLATRPVGGLPAVIAHENGHDLLYYRALDVGAANWTAQASLIDEHEKAGTGMRLLQVAGNPAVVYYDSGTNDLKYRRAQQLEGEYWTEPVILDARADGNQRAVVVDGRPTVLYGDRVSGELKFIAANDAAGRLWSFPSITGLPSSVLDVVTRMGEYAEIADGPAFAYIERHAVPEDMTATSLHYVTYH